MEEVRESALSRWSANKRNGRKGGRPRKPKQNPSVNPSVSSGLTQTKPTGKVEGGRWKDTFKERKVSPVFTDPNAPSPERFVELWNATTGVTSVRGATLDGNRREAFLFNLGVPGWWDDFQEALTKFPLQCSNRAGGWKPGADWILDRENLAKVLEGQFDWTPNGESSSGAPERDILAILEGRDE